MMRSLFSGVAGLKVHQTRMDVIGNNIANVNTTAYKSMSMNFSELMYQTTQKASGPNAAVGTAGKNARQIGLGVITGAISTAITDPGSAQTTNNPFDIRISGDSFFVVNNGKDNLFTRDGSFYVDAGGNLAMTSTGYNVMGWQVDETTGKIKQADVTALRIMTQENLTYDAEYTTNGHISGIVDKKDTDINSTSGKTINLPLYDNLGYSYTAKLSLHKTVNDGEYYLEMDDIVDSEGKSIADYYGAPLDQIARLGAAGTDVQVSEKFNPSTESFNVEVDGVTKAFTRAVTYDQPTNTYSVVFRDSDGNDIKPAEAASAADIEAIKTVYPAAFENNNNPMEISLTDVADAEGTGTVLGGNVKFNGELDTLQLLFGLDVDGTARGGSIDPATGTLTVTDKTIQGAVIKYNTDNGVFMSANGDAIGVKIDFQESVINQSTNATTSLRNFHDIDIDLTSTKQSDNGGAASLSADNGDLQGYGTGRKLGKMSGITIQDNGEIYAAYDNGMSRLLGQIAVAEFANASGLEKVGDNLYNSTLNSGEFDGIGVDIKVNGGSMNSGQLEMSNVDLSTEFTTMITTQRGFQANSRIITTSDSLLEELVNLKR